MAKQDIKFGRTDYTVLVYIPDPASTDGSGKTGLVAANLTVSYTRVETDNDVVLVDATSSLNDLSALTDAHNDWGVKEVSSTLAPGLYRLDLADAVIASGAWSAVVYAMITSSAAAASPMEFNLVAYDPLDATSLGISRLDAAITTRASQTSLDTLDDYVDTEVAAIKAKTDNLPSDPADASDIATSFTTVNTKLDTIDDFLDTEIAAIKTKTDQLVFTTANQVDSTTVTIANNAITAASMASDVADEIWAKACAEPSSVVAASPTAIAALSWILTLARNKIEQTATAQTLYKDDGTTAIGVAPVSDDLTTFTRGEFA